MSSKFLSFLLINYSLVNISFHLGLHLVKQIMGRMENDGWIDTFPFLGMKGKEDKKEKRKKEEVFCTKSMYPYLLKNGKKVLEKGEMMRDIMLLHICPLVKLYIKPLLTFYFLSLLTSTSTSKQYPLLLPTFLVLAFCVCV